jgi:hypothetical protein
MHGISVPNCLFLENKTMPGLGEELEESETWGRFLGVSVMESLSWGFAVK